VRLWFGCVLYPEFVVSSGAVDCLKDSFLKRPGMCWMRRKTFLTIAVYSYTIIGFIHELLVLPAIGYTGVHPMPLFAGNLLRSKVIVVRHVAVIIAIHRIRSLSIFVVLAVWFHCDMRFAVAPRFSCFLCNIVSYCYYCESVTLYVTATRLRKLHRIQQQVSVTVIYRGQSFPRCPAPWLECDRKSHLTQRALAPLEFPIRTGPRSV